MKLSKLLFVALSASFIKAQIISDDSAQIVLNANTNEKKYLIELTNGEKQWVTESEKWQLRGVRPFPFLGHFLTLLGRSIIHGHN